MKIKDSEHTPITRIAAAISHPVRFRILSAMHSPERLLSPNEYATETGHPLQNTAYHFRMLAKAGCVELADTRQVRGATEHIFRPTRRAMLWSREWGALPPIVREAISASAFGDFVRDIGRAVDAGAFSGADGNDDTNLAYGAFWSDEEGRQALMRIWNDAGAATLALESQVAARLADDSDREQMLVSYGSAAYRVPERSDRS